MATKQNTKQNAAQGTTGGFTPVQVSPDCTTREAQAVEAYNAAQGKLSGQELGAMLGVIPNRANNYLRTGLQKSGVSTRTRTQAQKLDPVERAIRDVKSRLEALANQDTEPPTADNVQARLERRIRSAQEALDAFKADPSATLEAEQKRWESGAEQRAKEAQEEADTLQRKLAALEAANAA